MNTARKQMRFLLLVAVATMLLPAINTFAGPGQTTYQAKIIKPDGYPLESSSVNFKFTILNPAGDCILFAETYSSVNMNSTGGLISFSLGSGVKTYPVSSPTFEDVFSNITPSLSCDAGGPVSYSPLATDIRKIVMQFHDGNGWQTLPAMNINAVPYAMYANDALKLNGKTDTDFVQVSVVPTCTASEAIRYNGTSFSCVDIGGSGAVSSGSVITALGYTPADGASLTTITSNISNVSSTVFSVSSTVSSLTNSVAASFAAITSSQWLTSGTTISYESGNVGIGTSSNATKLVVSGGVRISMEPASCDATLAGTLRYNSGLVEYCNGALWSAFGVAGAGITSVNGSTSGSQTFATGITGTVFNITSNNGVHTFNIPLAASGSVTAGLLSNADYATFTNKVSATSAAVVSALGYTPASATTVSALTSNLAAVSASVAAITSSQWVTSSTSINYVAGNVGIGTANPTGSLHLALNNSGTAMSTISDAFILQNKNAAANALTSIMFANQDGFGTGQITALQNTGNFGSKMIFGTKSGGGGAWNTSQMVLDTNGYVGIGTATPQTQLDVSGSVVIGNLAANNASLTIYTPDSGSASHGVILIDKDAGYGSWQNPSGLDGIDADSSGTVIGWGPLYFNYYSTDNIDFNNGGGNSSFNGRVAIGMGSAPTAKLHIAAGTSSTAALKFVSGTLLTTPQTGAVEFNGFNLYITDGTGTRRAIATSSSSGTMDNVSNINASTNMTLTPVGSVVVSSTTISTSANTGALVVKGGLGVAGTINTAGSLNVSGTAAIAGTLNLSSMTSGSVLFAGANGTVTQNNSSLYWDGANRRLGIGTNAPQMKLHVASGPVLIGANIGGYSTEGLIVNTSSQRSDISLMHSTTGVTQTSDGFNMALVFNNVDFDLRENGYMRFLTNSAEQVRITSTGNVGIGTTTPTHKLDVMGYLKTSNYGSSAGSAAGLYLYRSQGGSAGAEVAPAGGVGVGFLSFAGYRGDATLGTGALIDAQTPVVSGAWTTSSTPAYLRFLTTDVGSTAGVVRMTIKENGDVGIGTSTPGARLQVATPASGGVNNRWVSGNSNGDLIDITGSNGDMYLDHSVGARMTASTSTTINRAATFKIDAAPNIDAAASSTLIVNNLYALWVEEGTSLFGGNVGVGVSGTPSSYGHGGTNKFIEIQNPGTTVNAQSHLFLTTGVSAISGTSIGTLTWAQPNVSSVRKEVAWISASSDSASGAAPAANFQIHTRSMTDASPIERVRVTASGRLGIGVSNPVTIFSNVASTANHSNVGDQNGTGENSNSLSWSTNSAGYSAAITNTSNGVGANGLNLRTLGTTSSYTILSAGVGVSSTANSYDVLTVKASRQVGINQASPLGALTVNGTMALQPSTSDHIYMEFYARTATPTTRSGWFGYGVAGTNLLSITNQTTGHINIDPAGGGFVGIDNANPTRLLHVGNSAIAAGTPVANFQNADGTCTLTPAAAGSGVACSSDERLKENFIDLGGIKALEKILKFQAVSYNFKTAKDSDRHTGYRAQEVQKILPEIVRTDDNGFFQVYYDALIPWITEAIKELYSSQQTQAREIASVKAENAEIKAENMKLKERLDRLEKAFNDKK